jgi:ribosomal-protein-alanine N-acetyltransferase
MWVDPPASPRSFRAYLGKTRKRSYVGFLVCLRATGELVGVVNLSEVVRGCFESAYLGYYAFLPHAGRGYMTEGLGLAVTRAFRELKLHRLEANIQPANRASIKLVRRLGFRREGFSPRYLKLAGRWRDHERWAIAAEDWRPSALVYARRRSSERPHSDAAKREGR